VTVTIRVVVGKGTRTKGEGACGGLSGVGVEGESGGEGTFETEFALNAWLVKRPRTRQKITNASTKLATATQ
jgi:hypothetical protein